MTHQEISCHSVECSSLPHVSLLGIHPGGGPLWARSLAKTTKIRVNRVNVVASPRRLLLKPSSYFPSRAPSVLSIFPSHTTNRNHALYRLLLPSPISFRNPFLRGTSATITWLHEPSKVLAIRTLKAYAITRRSMLHQSTSVRGRLK